MITDLGQAFVRTAGQHGDRCALRSPEGSLSYRQLLEAAQAVSAELLTDDTKAPVAIDVDRNQASVVAILGTLLSDRAYVPIDAGYPSARRRFIEQDCGAAVRLDATGERITAHELAGARAAGQVVDGCAYLLYTSGSTGQPKGCLVTHRNVLSLFESTADHFRLSETDICSVVHSLAFDFSVWELWSAWLVGGTAWLAPREVIADPAALAAALTEQAVTRFSATPSLFSYLVAELDRSGRELPPLRSVVLGGEAVRLADVAAFKAMAGADRVQVNNMYGITETTVHVSCRELDGTERPARTGATPIGRELASLRLSLRDQDGQVVAIGQDGEIWIAGSGVCAGYLNRPELTRERFVLRDGLRWYRSGDRAFFDGAEYHYLDRLDRQVQLRGYRIELGEVEAALESLPPVVQAVCCVEQRSRVRLPVLVGYVQLDPAAGPVGVAELTEQVRQLLPPQAVPTVRLVDSFAMTSNGKIDLEALRAKSQQRQ